MVCVWFCSCISNDYHECGNFLSFCNEAIDEWLVYFSFLRDGLFKEFVIVICESYNLYNEFMR